MGSLRSSRALSLCVSDTNQVITQPREYPRYHGVEGPELDTTPAVLWPGLMWRCERLGIPLALNRLRLDQFCRVG